MRRGPGGLSSIQMVPYILTSLQWRHNVGDGVSNQQPHDCLLIRLLTAQIKVNIKAPRHWPLWGEFTGEYPEQRASNAENVSVWWRNHDVITIFDVQSDEIQNTHATAFWSKWIWWRDTTVWHLTILGVLYWKRPDDIFIVRKLQIVDCITRNSYCRHLYI